MIDEHWPPKWSTALSNDRRKSLETELYREVTLGHPLFGHRVSARAVGDHPDDIVFQLEDGRYAAVHLTWHQESDPQFPYTVVFNDLASLASTDEWG